METIQRNQKKFTLRDESLRKKRGEPGCDPLFRVRVFADKLNKRFDLIPKTARLCVDEQMCSTKMKHHLRQYMPNKPHKWGIKLFVLCDSFGYAYRFEIYNGAGDNVILPGNANIKKNNVQTYFDKILFFFTGSPDIGATANVVERCLCL